MTSSSNSQGSSSINTKLDSNGSTMNMMKMMMHMQQQLHSNHFTAHNSSQSNENASLNLSSNGYSSSPMHSPVAAAHSRSISSATNGPQMGNLNDTSNSNGSVILTNNTSNASLNGNNTSNSSSLGVSGNIFIIEKFKSVIRAVNAAASMYGKEGRFRIFVCLASR
jgi:hypothetical protein